MYSNTKHCPTPLSEFDSHGCSLGCQENVLNKHALPPTLCQVDVLDKQISSSSSRCSNHRIMFVLAVFLGLFILFLPSHDTTLPVVLFSTAEGLVRLRTTPSAVLSHSSFQPSPALLSKSYFNTSFPSTNPNFSAGLRIGCAFLFHGFPTKTPTSRWRRCPTLPYTKKPASSASSFILPERLSSSAFSFLLPQRPSLSLHSSTKEGQAPVQLSSSPSSESHPPSNLSASPHVDRLQCARHNVSAHVAQMLYEDMLLGRILEEKCAQMYYAGKVSGFVHLYTGQEAVSTGVLKTLKPDDYCVSTYRDHVHALSKGVPAREVFAELYGKQTGCSKGRGGSMHMFSKKHGMVGGFAYIGEQIPVALGFAYSTAYRRFTPPTNDSSATQVTVCFTGDGSTNIGQFYEALNIAAVAKLPIVFVAENNNWAIGMAHYRSTSVPEIYKKAAAFGLPGVEVDGMDVLAVRKAAREAVDRARRGEGPTLIEALTYRLRGHSLADPDELRAPMERKAWAERDPLVIFASYMKRMGYATDDSLALTKKKAREVVEDAVRFAEASKDPVVEDVGSYVFSSHYKPVEEVFTQAQLEGYAESLRAEMDYQDRKKRGTRHLRFPCS